MTDYAKTRTIWVHPYTPRAIQVLDQRRLPHEIVVVDLHTVEQTVWAIREMVVRGAPLIGATAAYGIFFACLEAATAPQPEAHFEQSVQALRQSRPTAVNLFWAIDRQLAAISKQMTWTTKAESAWNNAAHIINEDIETCRLIGAHALPIIEEIYARTRQTVNILTHCNAGRLGCIEWGTATSPMYQAHQQGIPIHVWVDETRPRNQGANLTAWELSQAGIPHTVIVDNTGGHLMQHSMVDMVIVGTDRTTRTGDVANKIGTYLKALAAHDNRIPFYVALPSTTIDWTIRNGLTEIPIEERDPNEVKYVVGWDGDKLSQVLITPAESHAANYGFDVTPARLITGLVTERGICAANEAGLLSLFPEQAKQG